MTELTHQVEAVNTAFYEAFETGDLELMRELWLESDDTICVHPGMPPVRGASAISRSWGLIMANTPYIQFFLTDVVVGVDGDIALLTCTENVLTGDHSPDTFGGGHAIATNVFKFDGERWRLLVHHSSPVIGPEMGVEGEAE